MTEQNYTLVGELPDYYPQPIQYAWFPTNAVCEATGLPSYEGYMSLHDMYRSNPELHELDLENEDIAELVEVSGVEDCTIYASGYLKPRRGNPELLAQLIVEDWDMNTLVSYAVDSLQKFYEENEESFLDDWAEFGPDSR